MKGDFYARFLGGWGPVMAPGYPTARAYRRFHALVMCLVVKALSRSHPAADADAVKRLEAKVRQPHAKGLSNRLW